MRLKKYPGNPILKPTGSGNWEKYAVCNPGAYYDNGQVTMLYRASAETDDYYIYMGLATSKDGFNFKRESSEPIYKGKEPYEAGCVEDPRIVKFGDSYFVTYACRAIPFTKFAQGRYPKYPDDAPKSLKDNLTRTGLLKTKDFRNYEHLGLITSDDVDDRDVVLFPEKINNQYVMLHRPSSWVGPKYGTEKPGIWMAFSNDLYHWEKETLISKPEPEYPWQEKKIGGSTPPIKTKWGWMVMYHGVQGVKPERYYRQGMMMLDLNDPRKVISRPKDFILEPTEEFEKVGIEENVVFATSQVQIGDDVYVYYGGADKVICVATAKMKDLIDFTMSEPVKS